MKLKYSSSNSNSNLNETLQYTTVINHLSSTYETAVPTTHTHTHFIVQLWEIYSIHNHKNISVIEVAEDYKQPASPPRDLAPMELPAVF